MRPQTEIVELLNDVKEQILYLQELGVHSLSVNMPVPPSPNLPVSSSRPREKLDLAAPSSFAVFQPKAPEQNPVEVSRLSNLPTLAKRDFEPSSPLTSTSNDHREKEISKGTIRKINETHFGDIKQTLPSAAETIEDIRADIGNCVRCPLHRGRIQIVHTTGNFQADLMFVGEAPGADEDAKGEPFVGRAGQLLTKIIEGIGMKREEVVIGNINRCRPPQNRQPTLPEAETCRPFLLREIAVIRPKVIVVMGNTALHNLMETKVGITRMRGEFYDYFGVKVMPTFHPAYLLRDPRKKREVWEDMKKVRDFLTSGN